jgi:hypothetical protein
VTTELTEVQRLISEECDLLKALLLEKNRKYGNSALEPKRIFSRSSPVEQILVRIDDKLSRIASMGVDLAEDEDTPKDLAGYLILLRVAQRVQAKAQTKGESVSPDFGFCPVCDAEVRMSAGFITIHTNRKDKISLCTGAGSRPKINLDVPRDQVSKVAP